MKQQTTTIQSRGARAYQINIAEPAANRFGCNSGLKALALAAAVLATLASPLRGAQMNSGFTYQGRLDENRAAVSGLYDFQFTLMAGGNSAAPVDTSPHPNPLTTPNVPVTNGLFTTTLD